MLLLTLPIAASSAQETAPAAAPADDLAMRIDLDRMTVPVTIAGAGPYDFIIDTGAERTVISRELAATLGLARGRNVRMTAMTGTTTVGTVLIPTLGVGTITSAPIESPALEAANLGAPGMLGIDTLQGHVLTLDFVAHRVTLQPASKRRQPRPPDDVIVVRAKSVFGQLIVTDARYRGRQIKVLLDTGAAMSMGNAALRARIDRVAAHPVVLTSVTGASLTADATQVGEIEVGGVIFRNLPIAFADVAPFKRFGLVDRPAVLLGMDALRLFRRVEIDFANREVRFTALPSATGR